MMISNKERMIPVEKNRLIDTVRKNRIEHEKIYIESMDGYRNECILLLERELSNARRHKVSMFFDIEEAS